VIFFNNLGSGPDLDRDNGKICAIVLLKSCILSIFWILFGLGLQILTKFWTLVGLGLKFKNSGLDLDRKI